MATTFDTLRAAKRLKGLGFNDDQAEGVADILRETRELDLSQFATKADLAQLDARLATFATRADLAEVKADLIKWVVGMGFAQVAMILAVLKLFPGGSP